MFLVGLYATEPEPLCAVAGGLLHYFMLATFFLMGAEAISQNLLLFLGYQSSLTTDMYSKAHSFRGVSIL